MYLKYLSVASPSKGYTVYGVTEALVLDAIIVIAQYARDQAVVSARDKALA